MPLKQQEEAEDFARLLFDATLLEHPEELTPAELRTRFIELTSPMLLKWERDCVNPYIEKILLLDEKLCKLSGKTRVDS